MLVFLCSWLSLPWNATCLLSGESGWSISPSPGTASKGSLQLWREHFPAASPLSVLAWTASSKLRRELRCCGVCPLTRRIVGACFLSLAAYVGYEAVSNLIDKKAPEHSLPGIILACVSLVVMPLLSRAKRRVGAQLKSAAMNADAKQTEFCTYLSAILLGGLLLNAVSDLWWADPAAALVMVPVIGKEGVDGLRGNTCCE